MKELIIDKNESEQRLDRFLKKYLKEAPNSFIYKMIRKKNIKLNGKRAQIDTILAKGDTVQLYLSDETIEKFRGEDEIIKSTFKPKIVYEDNNIILMNKPVGILSHSEKKNSYDNMVDSMINYLYLKGEYNPKLEKTFVPAICNRLDRNTSGIIIGAKNSQTLRLINEALRNNYIDRYYKTIVIGEIKEEKIIEGYLTKDGELNKVEVSKKEDEDSKKISTRIKPLITKSEYSLLEIQLLTGRTHQIRAHLAYIGHPIIGDFKYGNRQINEYFKKEFGLKNQILHGYKVIFNGLDKPLNYLNQREFTSSPGNTYISIERKLFGN